MASPEQVIEKYREHFSSNMVPEKVISKDYELFRQEALEGKITFYEHACNSCERLFRVKVSDKDREILTSSILTAHLRITPEGAASFATVTAFSLIFFGVLIGGLSYALGELYLFTTLSIVLSGVFLIKPLVHIPNFIAGRWRLEASNQMVLCILYVVIYMRHTSNLEHAIKFAGEHVGLPLSFDLRKVLWDVETGTFLTIKESLEHYLEGWRHYNVEFLEAFHLIEGSLYEPIESKRIDLLEKSLQVMLEGTYEKMLHYAHNLKSPITILHMLGIILPVLGLVMFPLIGSFLAGAVKWYHVAILYNVLLPIFIYIMGNNILAKRPTGYGESDVLRTNPELKLLGDAPGAALLSVLFGGAIVILGLLPVLAHMTNPSFDAELLGYKFLDYKGDYGPYGFWALILSLFVPIGLAVGMSFYYKKKTEKLIVFKQRTDELEQEFSGALFQLGNRIGDGIPTEVAFSSVAASMQGTGAGEFFRIVDHNIRNLGMSLQQSIFDPQRGSILAYPSKLIESSMKVLVESARKGSAVVSRSLITISDYTNRIRQVNDRLNDLMADVLSSMTSQISFLTPVIAGIVVGVGSMVVTIINLLGEQFKTVETQEGFNTGVGALASILRIEDAIPGFQFQLVVGIYVVEVILLLTVISTTIERGVDTTVSRSRISKNLLRGVGIYTLVSLVGIILFNLLAQAVSVVSTT